MWDQWNMLRSALMALNNMRFNISIKHTNMVHKTQQRQEHCIPIALCIWEQIHSLRPEINSWYTRNCFIGSKVYWIGSITISKQCVPHWKHLQQRQNSWAHNFPQKMNWTSQIMTTLNYCINWRIVIQN